MPYVITTTTPDPCVAYSTPRKPLVTRRAVATLDEAQRLVDNRREQDALNARPWSVAVRGLLNKGGGTIGPLPDGTVIEVEQITWPALALSAGLSYPAHVGEMAARGSEKARSEILAAASPKKRHDDRGA